VGLPGIRSTDPKMNKDHTEFYRLGDTAGLTIFYSTDGVTPTAIVVFFRADNSFTRLTRDNLKDRLAWDRMRLKQLTEHLERRRAAVFVWEVDPEAEKKMYRDDFSRDPKAKLAAWKASGKKLGLRYQHEPDSHRHCWYRPDGTLAREAYAGHGRPEPTTFIWRHKDGLSEFRGECVGGETIHSWRWCRPGTTFNIRYEICYRCGRPDNWGWYDRNGKLVRSEWDSNGDGVPDWFAEGPRGQGSQAAPGRAVLGGQPEPDPEGVPHPRSARAARASAPDRPPGVGGGRARALEEHSLHERSSFRVFVWKRAPIWASQDSMRETVSVPARDP
jgi:hypothetical protein